MKLKKTIAIIIASISCISLIGCNKKTEVKSNGDVSIEDKANVEEKSSDKVVKKFIEYIMDGDTKSALAMIEMPEGSVKDLKAFEMYLASQDLQPTEVKSIDVKSSNNSTESKVDVTIKTKENTVINTTVYAEVNENSKWVISSKEIAIQNWELKVPKGATVKLNDEELKVLPQEVKEEKDGIVEKVFDEYKIPAIIKGKYKLVVEHPLTETYAEDGVLPSNSKTIDLKLKKEVLDKGEQAVNNLLVQIPEKAKEGKDFGSLVGTLVSGKSKSLTSMQEAYDKLVVKVSGNYKEYNYYKYDDLIFSDLTVTDSYYIGDNKIYVSGTYTNSFTEYYASNKERLGTGLSNKIREKIEYGVVFEVDENGNYLQYSGKRIFSRLN